MRTKPPPNLAAACQVRGLGMSGIYQIYGPRGHDLRIIASDAGDPIAEGWEHVSVSLQTRTPNWAEMCFVKDLFWLPEEIVIQIHPPESMNISNHPYCLHMWRNTNAEQALPPAILVGIKDLGELPR